MNASRYNRVSDPSLQLVELGIELADCNKQHPVIILLRVIQKVEIQRMQLKPSFQRLVVQELSRLRVEVRCVVVEHTRNLLFIGIELAHENGRIEVILGASSDT